MGSLVAANTRSFRPTSGPTLILVAAALTVLASLAAAPSSYISFSWTQFPLQVRGKREDGTPCLRRRDAKRIVAHALGSEKPEAGVKSIIVVSDSTGQTATLLTERLLVQFEGSAAAPHVTIVPKVTSVERLSGVIAEANELGDNVLVMATLVDSTMASWARSLCSDSNLRFIDVMTPLIDKFSDFLDEAALGVPGGGVGISQRKVSKMVNREFFGMVEAVKFGQKHIAGLNPQDWREADLVLIGPSRVGKGPVAHYLAQRGVKVACLNTSPEEQLPAELLSIEAHKVAALTVEGKRLVELRHSRLREAQHRNMPMLLEADYASEERVGSDLQFAQELQQSRPEWPPALDITYLGVEECASALFRRVVSARRQA